MPIKWSAAKVGEAADKIEGLLNQAVAPLEQARNAANEAMNIPDLPEYIVSDFIRIIDEISGCLGGGQYKPGGWFQSTIERIRKDIPAGTIEAEKASQKYGNTQPLI